MGYAEGNTHGFTKEDLVNETWLFRLLDSGDFANSEELIDTLRRNGYRSFVAHITPFIELEVYADEFYEIKYTLEDHNVDYRLFY